MVINTVPLSFMNKNDFAQDITWTVAASSDNYIIPILFDDPYYSALNDGLAGVSSSTPTITMRTTDLPTDSAVDDSLTLIHPISGTEKTYKVTDIQRDGTGISLLYLQLQ